MFFRGDSFDTGRRAFTDVREEARPAGGLGSLEFGTATGSDWINLRKAIDGFVDRPRFRERSEEFSLAFGFISADEDPWHLFTKANG